MHESRSTHTYGVHWRLWPASGYIEVDASTQPAAERIARERVSAADPHARELHLEIARLRRRNDSA